MSVSPRSIVRQLTARAPTVESAFCLAEVALDRERVRFDRDANLFSQSGLRLRCQSLR